MPQQKELPSQYYYINGHKLKTKRNVKKETIAAAPRQEH